MIALNKTENLIEQGIRKRWHLGAQLYVSKEFDVLIDQGFGEAQLGQKMTKDHISLWMSASKPVTAIAIAQLMERGHLQLDQAVAEYIPEFAEFGKEAITLRHLLQHTAGLRLADKSWQRCSREEAVKAACKSRPEARWVPGEKAGYHSDGTWTILGELIYRIDGRFPDQYLKEEIFDPLGMCHSSLGLSVEQQQKYIDKIVHIYEPCEYGFKLKEPYQEMMSLCRPSGNCRGPARELGLFYEMLLGGGKRSGKPRILNADSVYQFASRSRTGMKDHSFSHTVDWGLGFMINSNEYGAETVPYGYGRYASRETFGHSGFQCSSAFADPKHKLAVVLIFNGMPGEVIHQQRMRACLSSIYEDLGLG